MGSCRFVPERSSCSPVGSSTLTGGEAFFNNIKFEPFVDALWRQAGEYYFLGYWPATRKGELHDIEVKVARKGVHVHVRRQRG